MRTHGQRLTNTEVSIETVVTQADQFTRISSTYRRCY